MKKFIKVILIVAGFLFVINLLLNKFFFKTDQNQEPEISDLKESNFDFSSTKPFYFQIDKQLYFSYDGKLSYNLTPIYKGKIEEAFISPNSNYALIYLNNQLILINSKGQKIFKIENCTDLIAVEADRKTSRFKGAEIQWGKNSDFFLITQDRIWDKNYSKKNKSSIYIYSISDNSFKPFLDLDEELIEDFVLSKDGNYLYYEFATLKGDLAFKKVDIKNNKIISEHFQGDSLRLSNINADSIFINYNKFKETFQNNSYNLQSIITDARTENGMGLFYKDKDTTVNLMNGTSGYGAFKGNNYGSFINGFFLPGNRFFIANISAKQFTGQLVIDTKTFELLKLPKPTKFYFNINSTDCNNFVFRYSIEPNVKFATSVSLEIEKMNKY